MRSKTIGIPTCFLAAILASEPASAQSGVISWNRDYYGTINDGSPTQLASNYAGVVSTNYWNNSYPAENTTNLFDNTGAATTLDIAFNSGAQYRIQGSDPGPDGDGTHNKRLLNGYQDMSGGNAVTVTISQIPYATYDVYVYMSSDTAGREGYVTDGTSTVYFSTLGSAAISGSNAQLTEATETTDLTPNSGASYAVFTGLTGSSQNISVFAAGNAGIAGFQVVESTSVQNSGTWIATSGNWSDSANWLGGMVAQGPDQTATFNGATSATATLDENYTIGSLVFSGADHAILGGGGSLSLLSTTGTPAISVAPGLTTTIAPSLDGTGGMDKNGTGTLELSGSGLYGGPTGINEGTLIYSDAGYLSSGHAMATGTALEFKVSSGQIQGGATTFTGGGTLRKTGSGRLVWTSASATFFMDEGAVIDVQEGTLTGGHSANEIWSGNQSDLNVQSGAHFEGVEANVEVNRITGAGRISTGYASGSYLGLTIGVANGSSQFDGTIANTDDNAAWAGSLVKAGTGTITLTGSNTYTGDTKVNDGTLQVTGTLTFRPTTNGVSNSVSGFPGAAFSFTGALDLDLSAASQENGNTWTLVNVGDFPSPVFGSGFSVTSNLGTFDESVSQPGLWEFDAVSGTWTFDEANGVLTYTATETDYGTWAGSFTPSVGPPAEDDDGDGLTNFAEYAFGLLPNSAASLNPISSQLDRSTGEFSYTRRAIAATGLTYTVLVSTDLDTWTEDASATASQTVTSTVDGVETVKVTVSGIHPLPQNALFVRMLAE